MEVGSFQWILTALHLQCSLVLIVLDSEIRLLRTPHLNIVFLWDHNMKYKNSFLPVPFSLKRKSNIELFINNLPE